MNINGYELVNEEKVNRAINGSVTSKGSMVGGVGENRDENGELTNGDAVIAEYDRLGGLIRLDGDNVKMGSFYDFKNKCARETPEPMLEFNINGSKVTVPADEPLPPIVRAAKAAEKGEVSVDAEDKPGKSLRGVGKGGKKKVAETEVQTETETTDGAKAAE